MVLCDRCNECWHPDCLREAEREHASEGPWMCTECRGWVALHGCPDVSLDFGLIDYLFRGVLPAQPEEVDRITKVAQEYRAHGNELQRRLPQLPGLPG